MRVGNHPIAEMREPLNLGQGLNGPLDTCKEIKNGTGKNKFFNDVLMKKRHFTPGRVQ